MNADMLINAGDELKYHTSRNEDGTNNGSVYVEKYLGHCYCIAKAPRYASDEEWEHNANLIVEAVKSYNTESSGTPVASSCSEGRS